MARAVCLSVTLLHRMQWAEFFTSISALSDSLETRTFLLIFVCPMLCNAWTEYKFTCVCLHVCVCVHFLSTQVRPLNGFLQLIG